jgi:hypothetical protein
MAAMICRQDFLVMKLLASRIFFPMFQGKPTINYLKSWFYQIVRGIRRSAAAGGPQ